MEKLTDSSDFLNAVKVADELLVQSALARKAFQGARKIEVFEKPGYHPVPSAGMLAASSGLLPEEAVQAQPGGASRFDVPPSPLPAPVAAPAVLTQPAPLEAPEELEGEFRGDKLESALYAMCRRGGFVGAIIADDNGLPLAVYNSPVPEAAIAAFSTVLSAALDKAGMLLGQHDANNISVDINYTEKMVMRQFDINETPAYLLIICPQEVDERGEVELSIEQIKGVLQGN